MTASFFIIGMKKPSRRNKSAHKGVRTTPSAKTKTTPPTPVPDFALRLEQPLHKLPINPLAHTSGFRRRKPKKLTPRLFVQAACLLVTLGTVSDRRWAGLSGLLGGCTLSKQALFERLTPRAASFPQAVLGALLGALTIAPRAVPAAWRGFKRVLVQDSTTVQLSKKLARFFPGASNQKGAPAGLLKIQARYDLLAQSFVKFSLSSYRRNDQAAAPDVLSLLQPGDLVLRDLGYFVLEVLRQIAAAKAFFLSRLRLGVSVWEAEGRSAVNLLARLRASADHLDAHFCLGKEKVPVRWVAIRLPTAVAAQRRRLARRNRDRRPAPSAERLALLGWALYLTNVPATQLSARAVAEVHGLRWRIETIFKAWKSYFALTEVPVGSKTQVESLSYSKWIFITLFQASFARQCRSQAQVKERPALSLLKAAQEVQSYLLVLGLSHRGVNLAQAWEQLVSKHCCYERRRRSHFMQAGSSRRSVALHPEIK